MIAVLFALPQESGEFRRALRAAGGRFGGTEIRVAHIGVGPAAATENTRQLLARETPRMLICTGFAGGLDPRLRRGDLLIADNVSSPDLRTRAQSLNGPTPRLFFGPLATSDHPLETTAAKAAFAQKTGALAVDMETAAVAEICRAFAVPLLAVRAISDAADAPLPVPFAEWFDLPRQRPRPWRLVRYLATHPTAIHPFADFIRGLPLARRTLADFLVRFLTQPG